MSPPPCLRFSWITSGRNMDVLDSPLNSAHQQGRRADAHLASGRYKEAIECHQKAADYLCEAELNTSVERVLESLHLQHHYHTQQQELIRLKQARAARICQSQTNMTQTNVGQPAKSATTEPTEATGVDSVDKAVTGSQIEEAGDQKIDTVVQTIEDCDSLLCMLQVRAEDKGIPSGIPEYITTAQMSRGKKTLKDNNDIIEELRIHNDALRYNIKELLAELDGKERELQELRQENLVLKMNSSPVGPISESLESEEPLPTPSDIGLDDLPNLQLAPLEKPEFDFTSFQLPSSHSPTPDASL